MTLALTLFLYRFLGYTLNRVTLFALVFVGRARKRKFGITLPPLSFDLGKAAFFSALLLAYVLVVNRAFDPAAEANTRGIPFLVVILGVIGVLMSYISSHTRFGRHAYAIGAQSWRIANDFFAEPVDAGTWRWRGHSTAAGAPSPLRTRVGTCRPRRPMSSPGHSTTSRTGSRRRPRWRRSGC